MPRRNDIAKILVILAACIPAVAQQSFDSYINHQKEQKVDGIERDFLGSCGVSADSERVFAINRTSKWERRKTLSQGTKEAETDFFDTAEVRLVDGKPRALNVWFLVLDMGQEANALICLDGNGAIRFVRAVTEAAPVEGTGPSWTYVRGMRLDGAGKVTSRSSYFADELDHHVATPKFDKDEAPALDWNPNHELVVEVLKPLGLLDKGKGR